jgi:hypothetical protein
MFDVGALAEFGKWNFGAALSNINGAINYNGVDEKIPQVMRAGVLYKNFFEDIFLHYSLGADYVKAGTETFLRAGAEAVYNNLLAGRAGYEKGNNGDGGFAFGVGVMYMEFSLEYAFNYYSGAEQSAHKIGLVYKFLKDGDGEKGGANSKKSSKAGKNGLRDFTDEDLIEELNNRLKKENPGLKKENSAGDSIAGSPIKYDGDTQDNDYSRGVQSNGGNVAAVSTGQAISPSADADANADVRITKNNYSNFIGSKIYLNPEKSPLQSYSFGADAISDEYAGQILTIERISLSLRGNSSLLFYLSDKKGNTLVKTARLDNAGYVEFSNIFLIHKDKTWVP